MHLFFTYAAPEAYHKLKQGGVPVATDICIIILTAFAIFGAFCLLETILDSINISLLPPSVTFMAESGENSKKQKHRIPENTQNNKIVFLEEKQLDFACGGNCEICEIIKDVLFTKKP